MALSKFDEVVQTAWRLGYRLNEPRFEQAGQRPQGYVEARAGGRPRLPKQLVELSLSDHNVIAERLAKSHPSSELTRRWGTGPRWPYLHREDWPANKVTRAWESTYRQLFPEAWNRALRHLRQDVAADVTGQKGTTLGPKRRYVTWAEFTAARKSRLDESWEAITSLLSIDDGAVFGKRNSYEVSERE